MKQVTRILILFLSAILLFTACTAPQKQGTKTDAEILAERRDIVEAEMRREMTVLWRAHEDVSYYASPDIQPIQIVAGRLYQGMPYSHGSGSAYSWLSLSTGQDSNGIYNISGLNTPLLDHLTSTTSIARLSNNCADAVAWAWNKISSTSAITGTNQMTPLTGCLKVGDYVSEDNSYGNHPTKDICKENGEEVMYTAYAQLQKADAVVKYNKTAGHAMMVVEVHTVKNGDTIDPEESYITVLHQHSGNLRKEVHFYSEELKENVYICGGVDEKVTFQSLFKQGYLPVTCKELIDPSPLAEESVKDSEEEHTKDTIFKGNFTSVYRISSITITIADKDGNVVQQLTGFGTETERNRFRLPRMNNKDEAEVLLGSIDLDALAAGTYRCTHTCQTATGNVITVRNFEFEI